MKGIGVFLQCEIQISFPSDKTPGTRPKRWGLIRDRLSYGLALKTNDIMENPGLFIFANCPETIRIVPTAPRGEANPEDLEKVLKIIFLMLWAIEYYKNQTKLEKHKLFGGSK